MRTDRTLIVQPSSTVRGAKISRLKSIVVIVVVVLFAINDIDGEKSFRGEIQGKLDSADDSISCSSINVRRNQKNIKICELGKRLSLGKPEIPSGRSSTTPPLLDVVSRRLIIV